MIFLSKQEVREEENTHPDGYCESLTCWCHFNVEYHEQVTGFSETVTEEEYQQALSFLGFGARQHE